MMRGVWQCLRHQNDTNFLFVKLTLEHRAHFVQVSVLIIVVFCGDNISVAEIMGHLGRMKERELLKEKP